MAATNHERKGRAVRRLLGGLGVVAAFACGNARPPADEAAPRVAALPAAPAGCHEVAPGGGLQAAVGAASPGSTLCLGPGSYDGPLTIDRALTLRGPREAVVRSRGQGTTISVVAPFVRLEGFTVDGSGGRFDTLDAAVHVTADDVVVDGLSVVHATFGILVEKVRRATVHGCEVQGSGDAALGLRGDSIRLWETQDSLIEGNRVQGARDVVVWYSSHNRLAHNVVTDGRYGTHFMYSHSNVVEDNVYRRNVVGIFAMYSRHLTLRRNELSVSSGPAGMGLGTKESGDLVVEDNRFIGDTVGVYIDTSPMQPEDTNVFRRNVFRLGESALVFHGAEVRNTFEDNVFRDNRTTLKVEGGADASGVVFRGNDYDDYAGYDLDGDGFGDLPYELRSLAGDLVSRHEELAFLEGTPALGLVDAVGRALPMLDARTLMRDERPRLGPLEPEATDAH